MSNWATTFYSFLCFSSSLVWLFSRFWLFFVDFVIFVSFVSLHSRLKSPTMTKIMSNSAKRRDVVDVLLFQCPSNMRHTAQATSNVSSTSTETFYTVFVLLLDILSTQIWVFRYCFCWRWWWWHRLFSVQRTTPSQIVNLLHFLWFLRYNVLWFFHSTISFCIVFLSAYARWIGSRVDDDWITKSRRLLNTSAHRRRMRENLIR